MKTNEKNAKKNLPTPTIEFENWGNALKLANDIISLCQAASLQIAEMETSKFTPLEKEEIIGANVYNVSNGLGFVKQILIPELFDNIEMKK